MLNTETSLALLIGFVCGCVLGWWRATVHARKLRHFEIDLDDWAHYDEQTRQAHRRGKVAEFRS